MGCHSSKQARRDLLRSPSPLSRSRSLPDNDHIVSLTSSTLGSLNLDVTKDENEVKQSNGNDKNRVLCLELAKARVCSDMIDRKIPKTPTETPPNEPESIDALELMAGFHGDYSPFDRRSFSFYPIDHFDNVTESVPKSNLGNVNPIIAPHSMSNSSSSSEETEEEMEQSEEEQSIQSSEIEPEKSNENPLVAPHPVSDSSSSSEEIGKETEQREEEQSRIEAKKNNAVIFYFTTLRGIRKTFDNCCTVKAILREYGVRVDERDVSMHGGFREELKEKTREGNCSLPRVFVDGKELGGVEEVKRLHDSGELAKVLEGCGLDLKEKGKTGEMICEACGDVRFVLCGNCSGSCRVFVNDDDDDDEEEEEEGGGEEWQRCSDCNENGIVRCPVCC